MKYDYESNLFAFESDDQIKADITIKKQKKAVLPKMKVCVKSGSSVLKSFKERVNTKMADYKVEFCKARGINTMKRILTENDFIRLLRKGIGYSVATAVMVVLLLGSFAAFDIRLGSEIIVNGKSVGFVYDYDKFDAIVADVRELTKAASSSETAGEYSMIYIPRLVTSAEATPEFRMRQALLSDCSGMIEAYAVYVDGELIGASMKEEDIFSALEQIKERYAEKDQNAEIAFDTDIKVRKEHVALKQLLSVDGIDAVLLGEQEFNELYTAGPEDTLWTVAESFNMSEDAIYMLNKNIDEQLYEGQKINVVITRPLVRVKTSYTADYIEKMPYETEKTEDNKIAKGKSEKDKRGIEGERHIIADISKINGIEVSRDVVLEQVIKEPQNEKIRVGTNTSIPNTTVADTVTNTTSAKSTGSFLRPATGVVSSRFGPRSRGNHTGLDIAASTGSPIYAADGGTVITAGWSGSYGKLVKIDHGNGFVTYYAHCSSINVSVGQKVKKGQLISRIGNTGNSTGPHLHFEVRKNGVPMNPSSYIN